MGEGRRAWRVELHHQPEADRGRASSPKRRDGFDVTATRNRARCRQSQSCDPLDDPNWGGRFAQFVGRRSRLFFSFHGFSTTHIDALCHVFWQGKMYNGFDAAEVGSQGARKCAIDIASHGISSRGVLLDIPKIKKVEWLEPGDHILPGDLDAAEKDHRVTVEEGDVLLIRTGRARRRRAKKGWEPPQSGGFISLPGLDAACLPWLHERKVAVLGCDGVSDVFPSGYDDIVLPIHIGTLVVMGIHLIDNADLEALASTCERFQRYEFQFAMGPLVLKRGTGSPVNPFAIF
jgi:kynurenine formamidase